MAFNPQGLRQISSKEATTLGLPEGYRSYTAFPFAGINQKDDRRAGEDIEFFWLENYTRVGDGFLRSTPDHTPTAFYTPSSPRTIVSFFFYDIGEDSYCVVFLDNGTAIQVDTSSGATTTISSVVGTFYDSSVSDQLPACVQWGTKYLLISTNNRQNDYWIWDGSLLFTSGSVAPEPTILGTGAGYGSTAPTITAFGGHGSGVTATATIDAGGVVGLKITGVGSQYQPGDIVQFRFSGGGADDAGQLSVEVTSTTVASIEVTDPGYGYTGTPTVSITGGGGAGATATATVSGGMVTAVTVTNPGAAYESAPIISFSGGSPTKAASARSFLTPQSLSVGFINQGGTGYTLPPTATLEGLGGTPPATISTRLTATGVSYIRVDSPGGVEGDTASSFYDVVPNVVFYPGSSGGAGAAATAFVRDGLLESVTVTVAGAGYTMPPRANYEGAATIPVPVPVTTVFLVGTSIGSIRFQSKGDGYVDAPAVFITPGFNTAAYARVDIMPYIVSGAAIETYQSRVWLVFPKEKLNSTAHTDGTMLVSDPSSLINFSTIFVNEGSVLRSRYVGLKQSNGYLYCFGDSSIDIVSNVQTSGDPSITTFNYQNIEPQIGTTFRDTIQPLGRSLYFTNKNGVFRLSGGAVTRVSEQINNIFERAIFPDEDPTALTPSAATAYIYNIRYYVVLLTITDPFTDEPRNVMFAYDEANWFVVTQTLDLIRIGTHIIEGDLQAYGTDGTSLYRLFTTPSTELEKVIATKLYGADTFGFLKLLFNIQLEGQDLSTDDSGAAVSIVVNTERPAPAASVLMDFDANLSDTRVFTAAAADVRARFLGLTLGSTSKDIAIYNISLGYTLDQGPIGADETNAPPVT